MPEKTLNCKRTEVLTKAQCRARSKANRQAVIDDSDTIPCPVCGKVLDRKNPEGFTYSDGKGGWRCSHSNVVRPY